MNSFTIIYAAFSGRVDSLKLNIIKHLGLLTSTIYGTQKLSISSIFNIKDQFN